MGLPDKLWLRRGEVIAGLGITAEVFDKLVRSRVVVAKYFPGQTRAFFEREAVAKVAPQERKEEEKGQGRNAEGAEERGTQRIAEGKAPAGKTAGRRTPNASARYFAGKQQQQTTEGD